MEMIGTNGVQGCIASWRCLNDAVCVCACRAEALQSIVQLMGEKDMFDYYKETYKVHGVDWTAKKAKQVLEAWQRRFTKVSPAATLILLIFVAALSPIGFHSPFGTLKIVF